MRPELYARITEKLVFKRLSYDVQLEIAQLLLAEEVDFLRTKGHCIEPAVRCLPFLVRHGFHPRLGARPMRDAVERLIGDVVAANLLRHGAASGRLVVDEAVNALRIEHRE